MRYCGLWAYAKAIRLGRRSGGMSCVSWELRAKSYGLLIFAHESHEMTRKAAVGNRIFFNREVREGSRSRAVLPTEYTEYTEESAVGLLPTKNTK
jgi:hypothetical protein